MSRTYEFSLPHTIPGMYVAVGINDLKDENKWEALPLALRSLQSPVNTEWGALIAGAAIATLPLLVLFAISSRRLIDGLSAGAVRG